MQFFRFFSATKTCPNDKIKKTISGQVDRAFATEAVDSGSIPGRVNQKL